jgi:hypothetical protein
VEITATCPKWCDEMNRNFMLDIVVAWHHEKLVLTNNYSRKK